MDLFLGASTPFLRFSTHTCTLRLLKTSLVFFLFFRDGVRGSEPGVRARWSAMHRNPSPSSPPHPQSQAFCLL